MSRVRVSWQSVKRPFDGAARGRFVLLLGPAKMGKTTVAAQLYKHLDPQRIFWISAGELDGWRSVTRAVGIEPQGVDVDELHDLGALSQLLESLRDGWHRVVVLDSFDGAARWAERHICRADEARRRDKRTGILKLDQRGFGLKLNWAVATVRDELYPITLGGTHVVVTCGLKSVDLGDASVLTPDIEGQGALVLPRYFGDVAILRRTRRGRVLSFEGYDALSVVGSRSGFPAELPASDFPATLLADNLDEAPAEAPELRAELPAEVTGDGEAPWWRRRYPELGPDYQLQPSDFEAAASGCVGERLAAARPWLQHVVEAARILKDEDRLPELERRDLALLCWAHHLLETGRRGSAA